MTTRPDQRLRLFVALELPEDWLAALAALQDEMRRDIMKDAALRDVRLRWARPEGLHLTLKFLGETEPGRLQSIEEALLQAVPDAPGFELSLRRLGSFEGRRAPRVIWVGVGGDTRPLHALVESIETWLAGAGFPREKRSFAPHLTLARLPEQLSDSARQRLAAVTQRLAPAGVAPFRVERVSLMRSHLGPGGARYERMFVAPPLQPE